MFANFKPSLSLLLFVVLLFQCPTSNAQTISNLKNSGIEKRFRKLDRNGDGKLTRSEIPRVALHERLDLDTDGLVTLQEARSALLSHSSSSIKDVSYGTHDANKYDIYLPEEAKSASVMLYVHGGAWKVGDKKSVGEKAKWFTSKGWIFISANYRLAPEGKHPNNVVDVAACIAHVHDNIKGHGGDPDSMFLMGHSAGCHLVALVATDDSRLKKHDKDLGLIKGVVALDTGSFDIVSSIKRNPLFGKTLKEVFGDDEASQRNASPIYHVSNDKKIAPFFVVYTKGSTHRRTNPLRKLASVDFVEKLKAAGFKPELIDATDRTHSEVNKWFGKDDDALVTAAAEKFLIACRQDKKGETKLRK